MRAKLIVSLSLFLLALAPRLPDLGRFLTADEFLWVDRSRNFLAALTNPAFQCDSVVEAWNFAAQGLACTLRTGHPGVTTMWTGSFGFWLAWLWAGRPGSLHDYVVAVATNPMDASFIAPERLGTVLITSLWVVVVYWLMWRLWGGPIALLSALLLALDPFHIALSRVIHHDALSTTFMTLSVLAMFSYWGDPVSASPGGRPGMTGKRYWLLLSGALAGFGFLSKSPTLYLMPFVALTGLWFTLAKTWRPGQGDGPRKNPLLPTPSALLFLIFDGWLWFAVAALIFVVFWPAMWVVPLETIQTVLFIGSKYATGGHAKGNFFLGETSQDPGALFYPVTWLYRTSPLVVIGVLGTFMAWLRYKFGAKVAPPDIQATDSPFAHSSICPFLRYLPLILLFILGYYLLMTIGEKKQDRYFLPVYPWLNLIAAAGLAWIFEALRQFLNLRSFALRPTQYAIRIPDHVLRAVLLPALLILLLNGYLVAATFPYYFTFFNPLLGGIQGAATAVTIGWGEGLDLAAAYLNEHTNPAQTRVASWYQSTFAPFYHGQAISYSKEKGKALAGDYVVFYINQTQRRFPDEALFDYFEKRYQPEKIITLNSLDYAWIYPSRGVDHYLEDQTYTGIASLLAWQWTQGDRPLIPGRVAEFDLYWEYLGKQLDEPFFFRLIDAQGRPWAEGRSQPVAAENPPPDRWRAGEIITEHGALAVPLATPPGQYQLQLGFYTKAPAVTAGELRFVLPETEALIQVGRADPAAFALPAEVNPVGQPLGDSLTLLGARWPAQLAIPLAQQPTAIPLELYWRVDKPLSANFALHVGLMDAAGVARQAWFELSLAETINPTATTWQPGDVIHTIWQLELLPQLTPDQYRVELVLPDANQPAPNLSLGPVSLIVLK
jgi:hypothetical protein